jgi:hypothetical protein
MKSGKADIQRLAKTFFAKCRGDWNYFIKEVFGVQLDAEQRAIVSAVQHGKFVSVRSGTARGKDFVAACCAVCWLYLKPRWNANGELVENAKVAMTAPTDRQVLNIMIPEVKRLFQRAKRRGFQLPGRTTTHDIRMSSEEWFLTGFKADDNNHEAWSGFHAVHTFFVVTEASGISDDTFEAIEGNLQSDACILIVFNPNITVGYAAKSQKSDRWQRFCLNSLTAPNVVEKRSVIPGQVDYEWVKDKVDNWCHPITREEVSEKEDDFEFEGSWYRPSDLFRKKVLGQFPKVEDDALIPLHWIEMAQERWKGFRLTNRNGGRYGIDVAGMGRDNSVRCSRFDNYVAEFAKHNSGGKADHMRVAGDIMAIARSTTDATFFIDTIGEGAGVYSRCMEVCDEEGLKAKKRNIHSCKFSEGAKDVKGKALTDTTGQYTFANMRAYLAWCVREWLDPDNHNDAMLPPGGTFAEEATEVRWSFSSSGHILIEAKDDIKARLGYSPDEFDALANTFYPRAAVPERRNNRPRDYDEEEIFY